MMSNASYCDKCIHKSVCRIRDKIVAFDLEAKKFEEENVAYKLGIVNVNYSCLYKKTI